MFRLPDAWVWDFWFADDGQQYHLFFLYASRALHDPDARHHRASIGHAVSPDLTTWERVADALVRSDPPAFDDLATWTGSVIRHPDGTWFMFYTGAHLHNDTNIQSIGYATSTDLTYWSKHPGNPVLSADSRWYGTFSDGEWPHEAFRDPWVMADPDGIGWHMLITAHANHGAPDDRGVLGHAWSSDLRTWTLLPPLTDPGQGFGQLEVTQIEIVYGQAILIFSCLAADVSRARRAGGTTGGVWAAKAKTLLGPVDLANAQQLTDSGLYSGRLIRHRDSQDWMFLAFHHDATDGIFIGEVSTPTPIHFDGSAIVLTSEAYAPMSNLSNARSSKPEQ